MIESSGIYLTNQSYQQNIDNGPNIQKEWFDKINRPIEYKKQSIDFLGYKLNNALGVPAGPLLSASWIELASKLNYSVITYKTIHNQFQQCHQIPNVIGVENELIFPNNLKEKILTSDYSSHEELKKLTITNSFGMPSQNQDYLIKDIPRAKKYLKKGQILLVSVVASDMSTSKRIIDDFYQTSLFAENLAADAIEINLSCPNVANSSSMLYLAETLTFQICKKITSKLKIPLIIKIGYIKNKKTFEQVLINADKAGVSAVSGINSYATKVLKVDKKTAALGASRLSAGICGYAIKPIGIHFTQMAKEIVLKNKLNLEIIAMGGVMQADDFKDYLDAGANIAMSATGMMWHPFIAKKFALKYQKMLISEN